MTALAITLPQGANEIQWMDWSSDEPGSASQWSPQGSKPFTTNGGEQMKFEPGMDTGGGAPAPAANDDDGDDSGPGDTVVVELANNLDSAVWFKFIYGGGASAEVTLACAGARAHAVAECEWRRLLSARVLSPSVCLEICRRFNSLNGVPTVKAPTANGTPKFPLERCILAHALTYC